MKTKKYKISEQSLPEANEPVAAYDAKATEVKSTPSPIEEDPLSEEKPDGFDACYAKLKAEADARFGVKERMTVDEYFGKLWHIVEGLYKNI